MAKSKSARPNPALADLNVLIRCLGCRNFKCKIFAGSVGNRTG